jgi:glycosyltransferase involved in cell wall biosynthesis
LKILLLYDYPPPPAGLATQGTSLLNGLTELGVEALATHFESNLQKEWFYRWFKPDVVVGVGYWGHIPNIVLHPQQYGMLAVPWLVADGFIANYLDILNDLPLILVTSNWVKEVYIRDGVRGDRIEVLPVGIDMDQFVPYPRDDPKVCAIRKMYDIHPEQQMILTVGGDGASKGAPEVMQALASLMKKNSHYLRSGPDIPKAESIWKYIVKVWPQPRTVKQNQLDLKLAERLGISKHVVYSTDRVTRAFMPYLYSACDIYAAPSRLEGFGMPHVEAGACGKPVIGIAAMAMLDTLVHGETAFLAKVAVENTIQETILGPDQGYEKRQRIVFPAPRIADYRADVGDLARYLEALINDPDLRRRMGEGGRKRAVENYDYRIVARRFVEIISQRLGIT